MPGNRVERLEEQVQELEATVEGLTEELVEANERIRQLEEALSAADEDETTERGSDPHTEVTVAGDDDTPVGDDRTPAGDEEAADDDLEKQFEVGADPEEVERAASDAVSPDGEQPADTSKGGEDETDDEEDDIIVA